jgi:hypothetical protein
VFRLRLYAKNTESDLFFPPPKSEYLFSATLGRIVFFLEKKHSLYGGRMQISKMGLILPYETGDFRT